MVMESFIAFIKVRHVTISRLPMTTRTGRTPGPPARIFTVTRPTCPRAPISSQCIASWRNSSSCRRCVIAPIAVHGGWACMTRTRRRCTGLITRMSTTLNWHLQEPRLNGVRSQATFLLLQYVYSAFILH